MHSTKVVDNRTVEAIRDYAALGDGRTVALVSRSGSVDWLCLPDMDSPSVFAALLDGDRGGRFVVAPVCPFRAERRYLPNTNVLETIFHTDRGTVRITDALTLPRDGSLTPLRELARRIEGLSGRVPIGWRVEPRFGYAGWDTRIEWRAGAPVASARKTAVGICAWNAGSPAIERESIVGRFDIAEGERALVALVASHQQPLLFPSREQIEGRLEATVDFWQRWSGALTYDGPWKDGVLRSALALKLLVYAPSGAIAAAATTSLPEAIGGERNWDYRYCWIRDSTFTLDALLRLGREPEAHAFFWWFMQAAWLTLPELQVFYRLDGGNRAPEIELPLAGYGGSRPVRAGNAAWAQVQLDVYGALLDSVWRYGQAGHEIDRQTRAVLASVADLVCDVWRRPDHGIWEVRTAPRPFTHSKAMCWIALDRAIRLARDRRLPARRLDRWRREAAEIRAFIDRECWSDRAGAYVRYAGATELDASLLLLPILRYAPAGSPRIAATIDAVRRTLAQDAFVYRYKGEDGLGGREGAFLACSFWLAHALALAGRRDEAAALIDRLVSMANDVGLYAEEIDVGSGAFLGNFPQALVHLALVLAAIAIAKEPAA